jgi:endonuclease/exonuclease/phosphatase family metal-dependent hydrolase
LTLVALGLLLTCLSSPSLQSAAHAQHEARGEQQRAGEPHPSKEQQGGERLLEVGSARAAMERSGAARANGEIKIVSYNIRWRGGEDLQKLIRLLREDPEIGGADIIGLQEVDRDKKRTKNTNTVKLIAEALGLHYAWAAPPANAGSEEEETGVALLSPHAMTNVERLVLPHEGPNKRKRAAIGATILVGATAVRAYSVHAETRMPLEKKVEHWRAVLEDLRRHSQIKHAVVVGDFNTIKGKDVRAARRLFAEAGFTTPFPDDRSTWRTFIINLKLDWLWLRGFEHAEHGIDKEVGLSDHWPLWVRARLDAKPGANVISDRMNGGSR